MVNAGDRVVFLLTVSAGDRMQEAANAEQTL